MNDTILVRPPVAHPDRFFIGGEWVVPSSSDTIRVIAPATEELYLSVAEAREADIDRAVAAARSAFDTGPWPRMSPIERAGYLNASLMNSTAAPRIWRRSGRMRWVSSIRWRKCSCRARRPPIAATPPWPMPLPGKSATIR